MLRGLHFFNTAGPVKPGLHDSIPPLSRLDRDAVLRLIAEQKYFVLHAPRRHRTPSWSRSSGIWDCHRTRSTMLGRRDATHDIACATS